MAETVTITLQIPVHIWEAIQRSTREMQERARSEGMEGALFDPHVQAAMLLEQAVVMDIITHGNQT
ncbi:MAG TPA: hypothetical protein VFS21_13220 [Roseiflexaceae bacterium]|nr:hypothetical protein [Roseiflexaceae bacterium]